MTVIATKTKGFPTYKDIHNNKDKRVPHLESTGKCSVKRFHHAVVPCPLEGSRPIFIDSHCNQHCDRRHPATTNTTLTNRHTLNTTPTNRHTLQQPTQPRLTDTPCNNQWFKLHMLNGRYTLQQQMIYITHTDRYTLQQWMIYITHTDRYTLQQPMFYITQWLHTLRLRDTLQ